MHCFINGLMQLFVFAVETQLLLSENCSCEFKTRIAVKRQNEQSKQADEEPWLEKFGVLALPL